MERQWSDRVPMHFEMSAYAEYGARKRAKATDDYKRKKRGHIKPNVSSGYLQRSLRHKITATQHGAKLTIRARLRQRKSAKEWAEMTELERARENRKRRRLATWQKREIAVLSRSEISKERKRQAREYRRGAMSAEYRRQRSKRIR